MIGTISAAGNSSAFLQKLIATFEILLFPSRKLKYGPLRGYSKSSEGSAVDFIQLKEIGVGSFNLAIFPS